MKLILKALSALLSCLPLRFALAVGRALGWVIGSVVRYRRAYAQSALSSSFPEKPAGEIRDILRRMYGNIGMDFVEMMRLPRLSEAAARELVSVENVENLKSAYEQGRGVLALCGHIGNWEWLATLTPLSGYPLTIIAKSIKNASLQEFWWGVRQRFGSRVLPAHNSYRPCLKALKNGGIIGFMLDQNMTRDEGIYVDFFGRPACTTPGLAYMAFQSRAPVVPVFICRQPDVRRHVIKILPAIDPPADIEPESVRAFTQHCTAVLEQIIREHPEQWTWIHYRWKTAPWKGPDRSGYQPPC